MQADSSRAKALEQRSRIGNGVEIVADRSPVRAPHVLRPPLGHPRDALGVQHHRRKVIDGRQLESAVIPENRHVASVVVRVAEDSIQQITLQILEDKLL